jgi:hypothetical protein
MVCCHVHVFRRKVSMGLQKSWSRAGNVARVSESFAYKTLNFSLATGHDEIEENAQFH